jgi:tetratricopeptide (TPR) repeat protein
MDAREKHLDSLLIAGQFDEAWTFVRSCFESLPLLPETEVFFSDCLALGFHYDAVKHVRSWLALLGRRVRRECAASQTRWQAVTQAFQLALMNALKRWGDARRLDNAIRWDDLADAAWAVNLRLTFLGHEDEWKEILSFLARCRARFERPYDLGNRLRHVFSHYEDSGDLKRCRLLARAALTHFAQDRRVLSRLKEINVHARLGFLARRLGMVDLAEAELRPALSKAKKCRDFVQSDKLTKDLAWIQAARGRFREAWKLIESLASGPILTATDAEREAALLWWKAEIALEEGRTEVAEDFIDRAQGIIDRRFAGYLIRGLIWTTKAAVEGQKGTPESRVRALETFGRAESLFRRRGRRGRMGLSNSLVARGHLHLRWGEIPETLDCLFQALEIAREGKFLSVQARCLLLKSYLLVDGGLPESDKMYEELLRELSLVDSSSILLNVLANLYLYTWSLKDNLDLTQHHFDQILALRRTIDREVFLRLYQKHVASRVAVRALKSVFGLDLPSIEEAWAQAPKVEKRRQLRN